VAHVSQPQANPIAGSRAALPGYLPIAEHGIIGDLHTAALVGTDGTIDWYCCPHFDSPSVFAAILDRQRGGYYRISPTSERWTPKQLYFPDTNVLITRFLTKEGVGEVQDFMPIHDAPGSVFRHRLIRRVVGVRGEITFRVEVEPRFNYGRDPHSIVFHENGVVFRSDAMSLALETATPLTMRDTGVTCDITLAAGESVTFVLERVPEDYVPRPYSEDETRIAFERTVDYWRSWLSKSRYQGRWREVVHRSALTLKLLTYRPTGGIVAAPTTSLPEQLGGGRNWDYRYTWIRDAAFSLYALLRLGFTEEAAAFMDWLRDRFSEPRAGEGGPLQIMYGIDGRSQLEEEVLEHLEGYRGSYPVRIGNGAADQLQLDIYGEAMDSIFAGHRGGLQVPDRGWTGISTVLDWVAANWDQPEEGIWETRGGRQAFTYGRLMSWVALDRGVRMAADLGRPAPLEDWRRERDRIYRQIMERAWHDKRRAFVQHYDTTVLDSALLRMAKVGFIAPRDPMWLATLDAMDDELVTDSLVYRYDPQASPDGLRGSEGTFSLCTFAYVDALARAGRLAQARQAFEKMFTYANHLGLYSEEIALTGEQIGNFPQAFTHLSLIDAAVTLDAALDQRR
jgi:GH15 family glucan-1,4-alpha-glucosidase